MQKVHVDLLAFTGHKALYGPSGTGGLIVGERVELERLKPIIQGGTGSHSAYEEQPDFAPDRYESGTLNTVGLAGLQAGIQWILAQGIDSVRQHEVHLTERMIAGLQNIPGVTVYGPRDAHCQTATVSITIHDADPGEIGLLLDEDFDILCRVGLHCAPTAHKTLGTFPTGAIRFGLGAFTTVEDVEQVLKAVEQLAVREAV
jgi:selenocysteine lyase/cysteine desulfurase